MSLLENYQLIDPDQGNDEYAAGLYEAITAPDPDIATPVLQVSLVVRFSNSPKVLTETINWDIAEEQFANVRLLVDHYLSTYGTLHIMDVAGDILRAAVINTDFVASIEINGRRVDRPDEDTRRSKFHRVGSEGTSLKMTTDPTW